MMVKIAYFDCNSGIAGDMILASMLANGLNFNLFKKELDNLNLNFEIVLEDVDKKGVAAKSFNVLFEKKQNHRSLSTINKIIDSSELDEDIKELSKKIFLRLGKAEAKVHNVSIEEIHFHEVGAIDAIVDIVGSVIGFKLLSIDKIYCSRINVGNGFVKSAHGVMNVPAPATAELIRDWYSYQEGWTKTGELTTPTGAAIITTLAEFSGKIPKMKVVSEGYGAGTKDLPVEPNVLKLTIGELN